MIPFLRFARLALQSLRNAGLCLVAVLLVRAAAAQTAPEGNAHPATQNVAAAGASQANPFGQHSTDPAAVCTPAEKAAFAARVDLEPLLGLSVFHNGRAKVLKTLAMETVSKITGRRAYVDFLKSPKEGGGENVTDVKYDPIFTLLDLTIDPAYYLEKPLVGIEYLPLRESLLEAAFPGDANAEIRERWKRVGRVTPLMIDRHMSAVVQAHSGLADAEPYMRASGRVDDALRMFMECRANFMVVAPATKDAAWVHISSLAEDHPARAAALALGKAWRARDASGVNVAASALAAELPKINASVYPTTSRRLEVFYNRLNAFEWGYWAYFVSLVLLLLAFGIGRTWLAQAGVTVLALALGLHATGFILRCMIAERFAIQNQFESMTGVSLFAATVGTIVMVVRRQWLFGAAAAAVGFMVLLTATQTGIPGVHIEREAAILNTSSLLKYHVTTVLVSYGLIALGFVCSLFYLGTHYFKGEGEIAGPGVGGGTIAVAVGGPGVVAPRAKLLADLDTAQLIILQLAFWTLGVGILLGAWWADHSWGRWWAFDPKEIWALITWIVYLIVVHVRIASPGSKGIATAWLSVVGFVVMLWTYFGVNLLLPGLHAYA
ncbi:MAG: cytochrome c biogenesis protein CcsA [Phycisphaerae bacterium]